jgi:hypothetical protein
MIQTSIMPAITNLTSAVIDQPESKMWLKYIRHLSKLVSTLSNVVEQQEETIRAKAEMFYMFAMNPAHHQGIFSLVQQNYLSADDEKLSACSEEILGYAIDYFRGLLEDCNIWVSDMLGANPEDNSLETFVSEKLFNEERIL